MKKSDKVGTAGWVKEREQGRAGGENLVKHVKKERDIWIFLLNINFNKCH